jgi:hypothetical protein
MMFMTYLRSAYEETNFSHRAEVTIIRSHGCHTDCILGRCDRTTLVVNVKGIKLPKKLVVVLLF